MSRVEQFRTVRQTRLKYSISFLLFFILLITGICVVDYAVNSITRNVNKIDIISVKSIDESYYELSFANEEFYLDTKYIKRDFTRLKNSIMRILGKN